MDTKAMTTEPQAQTSERELPEPVVGAARPLGGRFAMTTRPTPEQARAYAEVLIAWSEGKSTQMRDMTIASLDASWQPFDGFYRSGWEYRIVPDPPKAREWWINCYSRGVDFAHHSFVEAERVRTRSVLECVHVREILDTEIVVDKAEYEELRRNEAALKTTVYDNNRFPKGDIFARAKLFGAKL